MTNRCLLRLTGLSRQLRPLKSPLNHVLTVF